MKLDTLAEIASDLACGAPAWTPLLRVQGQDRSSLRVLATDAYDAWLIWWPPATSVTPHDHGESAGAFCVLRGELQEIRWAGGTARARRVPRGETVTIPPRVVHDVIAGQHPTLSVHVYAPPLDRMSFYDPSGSRVVRTEAVDQPLDPHAFHPAVARRAVGR